MSEKMCLTSEEEALFQLLAFSLQKPEIQSEMRDQLSMEGLDGKSVDALLTSAGRHKVLSLMYPGLEEFPEFEHRMNWVREQTQKVVSADLRLLFLDKYILEGLKKEKIPVLILKGMATAYFYPYPELRKSGDVDLLLLDTDRMEDAKRAMEKMGFSVAEEQLALHHVVFESAEGIEIELHTLLAEPFDNEKTNRYLAELQKECSRHVVEKEYLNVVIPQLDVPYHAFELLLHMLQHFLRSGFGLKLLCDWVVFWNQDITKEQGNEYLKLVETAGIKGFSDMITGVCCHYLGLNKEKVAFMKVPGLVDGKRQKYAEREVEFLREILEAEEFGKTSSSRMVALRGNGIGDYVREFHHQMHLNFPKAGRCFLLWPVLWMVTLIRFLINNRKIRKVSVAAVMKKAGQRGKLIKQMKLFETR